MCVAGVSGANGHEPAGPPSGGGSHAAAPAGMFAELGDGSAGRREPKPPTRPDGTADEASAPSAGTPGASSVQSYDSGGTHCTLYANSAGMGSSCSSGNGVAEPLIERFPEMRFDNCRYDEVPAGVDVPPNPEPDRKQWRLRTCLTGIDWFSYDGGDDRQIAMELVLVDRDADLAYHHTPLSEILWDSVQTGYPIPMLQVRPRQVPVVGQPAYLTFDWLDGRTNEPVSEGPYAGEPGGGPYVERANRGLLMRARAGAVTIDPQIEGVRPFSCRVSDLGYDTEAGPLPGDQRSDCYYVFSRSSAAAEDLSTAEGGDPDAYQIEIDVRWDVEYGSREHGFRPFGSYHMIVHQDVPVMDSLALNIPSYEGDVG